VVYLLSVGGLEDPALTGAGYEARVVLRFFDRRSDLSPVLATESRRRRSLVPGRRFPFDCFNRSDVPFDVIDTMGMAD
jgi:hypothetical protein